MVTGGAISLYTEIPIATTEMLVLGDTEWRSLPTARLPSPRSGLGAATLDNKVLIFGKRILSSSDCHSATSNDINVNRRSGVV